MVDNINNSEISNTKPKTKFKLAKTIIWSVFYFVIIMTLCFSSTALVFRNYFSPVYIDGSSMLPTLNKKESENGRKDFGLVDTSKKCIDSIELYDIITCYFPPALEEEDYNIPYTKGDAPKENASHKIKRVVALPNQTFQIIKNDFYFFDSQEDETGEKVELPFERKLPIRENHAINTNKITLAEDEYFVMGDNWSASKDCADYNHPIYKDNIVGVLIAIIGTCKVEYGTGSERIISDKQYHWPVFYK